MLNDKIYSVDLMWSKATGDITLSDNFRKASGAFQKAYQVFTTPDAVAYDVLQAPGIPAAGSSYDANFIAVFANAARPQRISPSYWIVTIDYTGEIAFTSDQNQDNQVRSPLFAPAVIDWDDVETEEEVDEDFDGNPIVTANGEAVNGVRRKFADQTATIQKNMISFNPYIQGRYRQSVNSDTFLGWPAGTGKMMKLRAKGVASPDVPGGGYYQVTAVIQFRIPYRTTPERAWYSRRRHEGFYRRIAIPGGNTTKVIRATKAGEPTTKPVLLDENGFQLPDVEPPNFPQAFWRESKLYEPLSYNALGLLP
jgi:hypothetical protein